MIFARRELRKVTKNQAEGVSCHGILWLLDQMEHEEIVAVIQISESLQHLAGHRAAACRQPRSSFVSSDMPCFLGQ